MIHRLQFLSAMLLLPFLIMCHKTSSTAAAAASVPSNYYLYSANSSSNDISMFQMNANTGILTKIAANVPAHSSPINLAGGGGGAAAFLYAANSGSNDISGYSVNPATGALTSLAGSPFSAGFVGLEAIAGTPGYIYAVSQATNKIYCFTIDQVTGALTANGNWSTGSTPVEVVVDDTLSFVYVANNSSNNLSGFSINQSTGALTPVPGSPFAAGATPNGIANAGPFLFVAATGGNQIASYTIDQSTGALTAAAGSPFASSLSYVIGAYPTSQFVYIQGGATTIEGHTSNSSAVLSGMTGSPFSMGSTGPNGGFTFDPTLHFMYAHGNDGTVYAFAVDPVTGALTALSTPSFAAGSGSGGINSLIMGAFPQ